MPACLFRFAEWLRFNQVSTKTWVNIWLYTLPHFNDTCVDFLIFCRSSWVYKLSDVSIFSPIKLKNDDWLCSLDLTLDFAAASSVDLNIRYLIICRQFFLAHTHIFLSSTTTFETIHFTDRTNYRVTWPSGYFCITWEVVAYRALFVSYWL